MSVQSTANKNHKVQPPNRSSGASSSKDPNNLFGHLAVVYRKPSDLAPYQQNARTHSKAQINKIAESIRAFGFTNPVLIDRGETIIAGHGRVAAAKLLEIEEVPTILLESLSPEQIRAYVIADNRLAEDAGWDEQILRSSSRTSFWRTASSFHLQASRSPKSTSFSVMPRSRRTRRTSYPR